LHFLVYLTALFQLQSLYSVDILRHWPSAFLSGAKEKKMKPSNKTTDVPNQLRT
jgi:hypothetical protein